MLKRLLTLSICIVALCLPTLAAPKQAPAAGPDKAYLQEILDAWSSMNAANVEPFYATSGDRLFFDIAPVKYNNWDEYKRGVAEVLMGYKTLKLTLNDDAQIHHAGDLTWSAATGKFEGETTTGKHELATFRWTLVFQKTGGKWLVVHEHFSEPLQ